jgi:hypothetical protein
MTEMTGNDLERKTPNDVKRQRKGKKEREETYRTTTRRGKKPETSCWLISQRERRKKKKNDLVLTWSRKTTFGTLVWTLLLSLSQLTFAEFGGGSSPLC